VVMVNALLDSGTTSGATTVLKRANRHHESTRLACRHAMPCFETQPGPTVCIMSSANPMGMSYLPSHGQRKARRARRGVFVDGAVS